ncbi:hypothetical protein ACKGJI_04710 [Sulfurospirillum sp. 1307]|jgi:hypothetical protein
MTWLNKLKIAVIEEDIETIGELMKTPPSFSDDITSAKEALALVNEAINLVEASKAKVLEDMNKIRKTKAFLNSH